MNIGFVAHAVHRRGGMERAAAEVLTRLAERHQVHVVAEVCEVEAPGLTWDRIRAPRKPSLLNTLVFRRRASASRDLGKCDLVASVGAAAIEADVVTAQFCHAAFTNRFGGIRGGKGRAGRAWQRYVQRVFVSHERRVYSAKRLRRVISVSQGTARELSEFYGVDPAIIDIIPNGVDHRVFRPAESVEHKHELRHSLGIKHDGLLAAFVGGDWDRKGVATAIQGVARAKDVHLAIVGRWNAEPFRLLARNAGAEDRVYFPGESHEPQKWMAAADVFLFPSLYEAFSLVTIEAAACRLALLATNINGTDELVEPGLNGFFIHSDADDIADKLVRLRDDDNLRESMATAAFERSKQYTWNRIAAATETAYERARSNSVTTHPFRFAAAT
jgi:UDP-glucose:(heptosyl)LPS alpha-1,3-glucosyltransferase